MVCIMTFLFPHVAFVNGHLHTKVIGLFITPLHYATLRPAHIHASKMLCAKQVTLIFRFGKSFQFVIYFARSRRSIMAV
jgi:hypothetical protein